MEAEMLKSTPDRYGSMAASIHWLSAILIVAVLVTGFQAANTIDPVTKAGLLRFHIPVAIIVLLLTAFRIVWWWRFDAKPIPVEGSPVWRARTANAVHVTFYVLLLGMIASGIAMMILSAAAPAVFGDPGAELPDFSDYTPRAPHGLGARLMVVLLVIHTGAALHHQFIRGDGLLLRMWFDGRR